MTKDDKGNSPVSIDNTEKNCMTSFAILAYTTVICDILWISIWYASASSKIGSRINKQHFFSRISAFRSLSQEYPNIVVAGPVPGVGWISRCGVDLSSRFSLKVNGWFT